MNECTQQYTEEMNWTYFETNRMTQVESSLRNIQRSTNVTTSIDSRWNQTDGEMERDRKN